MSKVIRKLTLRTIAKVNDKYTRIYWSWYAPENENELLYQLTKILEEDDDNN